MAEVLLYDSDETRIRFGVTLSQEYHDRFNQLLVFGREWDIKIYYDGKNEEGFTLLIEPDSMFGKVPVSPMLIQNLHTALILCTQLVENGI